MVIHKNCNESNASSLPFQLPLGTFECYYTVNDGCSDGMCSLQLFLLAMQHAQSTSNSLYTTYLEPAAIGTASLTFSTSVCALGSSFFFPARETATAPNTAPKVPSVRYSFLTARPKITLQRFS